MTEKNSGPEEGIKGVVEDVKGKAKEAVGTVTGRDDLTREGKAQQDKADAQKDVAKKEAEAESARGGAKAAEKRQRRQSGGSSAPQDQAAAAIAELIEHPRAEIFTNPAQVEIARRYYEDIAAFEERM